MPSGSNKGDIEHERAADGAWASLEEGGEGESERALKSSAGELEREVNMSEG